MRWDLRHFAFVLADDRQPSIDWARACLLCIKVCNYLRYFSLPLGWLPGQVPTPPTPLPTSPFPLSGAQPTANNKSPQPQTPPRLSGDNPCFWADRLLGLSYFRPCSPLPLQPPTERLLHAAQLHASVLSPSRIPAFRQRAPARQPPCRSWPPALDLSDRRQGSALRYAPSPPLHLPSPNSPYGSSRTDLPVLGSLTPEQGPGHLAVSAIGFFPSLKSPELKPSSELSETVIRLRVKLRGSGRVTVWPTMEPGGLRIPGDASSQRQYEYISPIGECLFSDSAPTVCTRAAMPACRWLPGAMPTSPAAAAGPVGPVVVEIPVPAKSSHFFVAFITIISASALENYIPRRVFRAAKCRCQF
ncbi:hypothetical protein B0T10DRAFT_454834 [Thelonectria olida]|uniref:Uncharacterized protein n=1 Tax=Thelonectria olida TaxID=1576542 RepID=A0A9P8WGA9_9HYPO|nr:hypothetical protein B0T10DRAFT_454834 [Thelonectria olida]